MESTLLVQPGWAVAMMQQPHPALKAPVRPSGHPGAGGSGPAWGMWDFFSSKIFRPSCAQGCYEMRSPHCLPVNALLRNHRMLGESHPGT